MGSTSCCQTNRKRDGNTFLNMFAVGLVLLNEHPFLVGVTLGTSWHISAPFLWPGMMIPNGLGWVGFPNQQGACLEGTSRCQAM